MPTTLPRISTVVEPKVFKAVEKLAREDGVSVSQKTRDLLLEALTLFEDETFEALVRGRRKNKAPSISHKDFWKKRGS